MAKGEREKSDDIKMLMDKLTDIQRKQAISEATERFFNKRCPWLEGKYHVKNYTLTRGESTDEEMKIDALRFSIDPAAHAEDYTDLLMDKLEKGFDRELYNSMLEAVKVNESKQTNIVKCEKTANIDKKVIKLIHYRVKDSIRLTQELLDSLTDERESDSSIWLDLAAQFEADAAYIKSLLK